MIIRVTEKHIKNGRPGNPISCPVGLAIADVIDNEEIRVGKEIIIFPYAAISVTPPRSVSRFIRRFDAKMPVKPFNFILQEI